MSRHTGVELARRPDGMPVHEDFAMRELVLPELADGEVEIENLYFSVDPYMRNRMNPGGSYLSPFPLDEVMSGRAVGQVTKSRSADIAEGDFVQHNLGWRTGAVAAAAECRPVRSLDGLSMSAYLGILGWTGWTAWIGTTKIADIKAGETVFVSAASGAVGSAAGQYASILGATTVIGSTGSAEKVRILTEQLGFNRAFNYRDRPIEESLARVAPDGIDVYYDNVGGEHLHAAWNALRKFGRVVACGSVADYNAKNLNGLPNIRYATRLGLRLQGFALPDYPETLHDFEEQTIGWLSEGKLHHQETVFDGLDSSLDAFLSLFSGEKVGKVVVRVG